MIVDLAYREAGDGPPLVLLHAFPLSSAMWLDQRAGLAAHCRIITPDLRGFGGSELGTDPPSLAAVADDVAALLDTLDLDRVTLGGLSMGGYVAMMMLRRHADRICGMVLADTKAGADPDQARANRERIATAVLADPGATVLVDEVLPALVGQTTMGGRAGTYGRIRALVQAAPAPAVAWAQRAMATRPDSFDVLRACRVPGLVIVGDEDTLSPPQDAQAMSAALPDATLVTIAGAGHLSAMEDPDAFNAAVADFLARA